MAVQGCYLLSCLFLTWNCQAPAGTCCSPAFRWRSSVRQCLGRRAWPCPSAEQGKGLEWGGSAITATPLGSAGRSRGRLSTQQRLLTAHGSWFYSSGFLLFDITLVHHQKAERILILDSLNLLVLSIQFNIIVISELILHLSQCSRFQEQSLSCAGLWANYHSRSAPFSQSGLCLCCSGADPWLPQSWYCVKSLPLLCNNGVYSGRAESSFSEKTYEKNKLGAPKQSTAGCGFTDHLHFFHLKKHSYLLSHSLF